MRILSWFIFGMSPCYKTPFHTNELDISQDTRCTNLDKGQDKTSIARAICTDDEHALLACLQAGIQTAGRHLHACCCNQYNLFGCVSLVLFEVSTALYSVLQDRCYSGLLYAVCCIVYGAWLRVVHGSVSNKHAETI